RPFGSRWRRFRQRRFHSGRQGFGILRSTNLFIYTPKPAVGGLDFFDYTIQDGDGDTSTARVWVDVDSKPQIDAPQDLVVDEDGLPGHNVDGNPVLRPGETDSTESATQTGSGDAD